MEQIWALEPYPNHQRQPLQLHIVREEQTHKVNMTIKKQACFEVHSEKE